jgi:signal peptidase II
MTRWLVLGLVGAGVAAADQVTKEIVRAALVPGEALHALGPFSLAIVRNPGIAGGGLDGNAVGLSVLATAAIAAVLGYLAWKGIARTNVLVGFGLLLGGGLGNLVDRLRLGYVTDFIVQDNHVFNLADVAILAGSTIILLGLLAHMPRLEGELRSAPRD